MLHRTNVTFKDNRHLLQIIDKIVSAVGRRVDESTPMVDARLKDGSRVNAIIPPLAIDGPILSIRRFGASPLTAENLLQFKALSAPMLETLRAAVQARLNIVISGGTGSGKTTLLNMLSSFISEKERIVTIEDSAELQLQPGARRPVWRRGRPTSKGRGAIRQRELVINALRMRPDRIVLGEVRGEEALDMLQAMNTGHDGSITTIHANTPRDGTGASRDHVHDGRHPPAGEGDPAADFVRDPHHRAGGAYERREPPHHAHFRTDRQLQRCDQHAGPASSSRKMVWARTAR